MLHSMLARLSGVPAPPTSSTIAPPSRADRSRLPPCLADPDTPLLHLSPKDAWTIRDAFAGVHVFGGNGSGKTSGSGKTLAKAYLKAGFGGLVLIAKPDERATWERYAAECGRTEHLIVVDDRARWRLNFMHYEMARPAYGRHAGFDDHVKRVENLVSTLMNVLEQAGRDLSGSEDQIWVQSAEILLRNALLVVATADPAFTLADLTRFIDGAPASDKAVRDPDWPRSAFARALDGVEPAFRRAGAEADYQVIRRYWTVQFPGLAEKTRASILFTLTALMQDLQTGTLRRLFGDTSTFVPEDTHNGAIVLVDLPAVISRSNVMAQILLKVVWQQAALRRMEHADDTTRPVFLWADEAHFFVSRGDTDFQSLARGARVATVFLTQNLNAYYQRIGGRNPEAAADALLGYFQTLVFHAQSDPKTIQWAQSLFGKKEVMKGGLSHSSGDNRTRGHTSGQSHDPNGRSHGPGRSDSIGENSSLGVSLTQHTEDAVRPEQFNALANGGPAHANTVHGLVWRSGRIWQHSRSVLLLGAFDQGIR